MVVLSLLRTLAVPKSTILGSPDLPAGHSLPHP